MAMRKTGSEYRKPVLMVTKANPKQAQSNTNSRTLRGRTVSPYPRRGERALPSLRLHARASAAAHRGCVVGPRLDVQAVSCLEEDITIVRVKGDRALETEQDLVIGV